MDTNGDVFTSEGRVMKKWPWTINCRVGPLGPTLECKIFSCTDSALEHLTAAPYDHLPPGGGPKPEVHIEACTVKAGKGRTRHGAKAGI